MQLPLGLLLFLLSSTLSRAASPHKREHSTHNYYVLEHDPRVGVSLSDVAQHLGVQVVERAGELENFWLVRQEKPADGLEARDSVLDIVNSIRRRSFASLLSRAPDPSLADRLDSSIRWISPQERRQRFKRAPPPIRPGHDYIKSADVAAKLDIHDPEFPRQWHLSNDEFPEHMMNISGLWEMGITGKGVISALVDDGLDWQSKDLADNFYAEGSYDYNDHEPLPTPKLYDDHHGTRCAGQIAAVKNDVCGVGIAYESKVAGLRILSGPISDVDEAASLNNDYQNTAIYSCSWGPPDNGKSMEAPGYLIERAMINGIENGRHGKGSIYVFASGNGAGFGDQCNFDGYTNSIYSVTVSAIDYKGLHPYYSEPCAANLIVAYSSGSGNHIVTTDINGKCADSHGGTSAAAPNAVGVYALALSVRPELTWRDIQHLNVRTAEVINPNDRDWETTAAGRQYSYKYGYGRLDGYKFVMAAKEWELVKPQAWIEFAPIQIGGGTCDVLGQMEGGDPIPAGGLQHTISVTQDDLDKNNFATLEHVTVRVWIKHARRGDVEVELISPNGVKSILAASRKGDADTDGFPGWRFMTVKHWDENPLGDWTLRVGDIEAEERKGTFLGWQLSLFGAVQDPAEVKTYELSSFPILLPSVSSTTSTQNPSPTKTLAKPGDHLPTDHGTAPGEADKPAFDNTNPSAPSSSSSMTPTPDEGWFAGMGTLATNGKWFFGAAALVLVFGIGAGIFFWRRRIRSREAAYSALPGDNVAMRSIPGSRGTKELYNAFGEGEDDDEDADEQTRLAPDRVAEGTSTAGLGFHSEFLDDDDASAAGTPAPPRYHDAPESEKRSDDDGSRSPVGSGSADGSWEHASQTR